jgi:hypothetical protein
MDGNIRIAAGGEDAGVFSRRTDLDKVRGHVFARLKKGDDGSRQEREKKGQANQHPMDADYTPIVEKVKLNFVGLNHAKYPSSKSRTT